ncbi:MAG: response regulator transcription factor [Flavobacteriales bacterium]|nr:response regulator transcription factor [Flavobacteriales bacterium]
MPNTTPLPVALIDDHTLFRNVMTEMINGTKAYKVVAEAGHGVEYQQVVADGRAVAVAIVDLHMPVMDGYQTIAWIRANQPGTRALALTFEKTEEAMVRALRAGACGFLLKDVRKQHFLEALEQVATVGHYHNEELLHDLNGKGDPTSAYEQQRAEVLAAMSERELIFLRLVCDEAELTYEQIAARMELNTRQVDGHRESLFAKFNIKSKPGLVIFAYKWDLLHP